MADAAFNDLSTIRKLAIICDDCGRRRVWARDRIARAQLRWGVRSAVQLGTKLVCHHCSERGQGGHNVSIYAEGGGATVPLPAKAQPDAQRDLGAALSATSTCSDCGHQTALDRATLDGMPDVRTLGDLCRLAFCPPCRALGATTANVEIVVAWPTAPSPTARSAEAPAWSTKAVFGEERDDPFANLPKSRLMRCG